MLKGSCRCEKCPKCLPITQVKGNGNSFDTTPFFKSFAGQASQKHFGGGYNRGYGSGFMTRCLLHNWCRIRFKLKQPCTIKHVCLKCLRFCLRLSVISQMVINIQQICRNWPNGTHKNYKYLSFSTQLQFCEPEICRIDIWLITVKQKRKRNLSYSEWEFVIPLQRVNDHTRGVQMDAVPNVVSVWTYHTRY